MDSSILPPAGYRRWFIVIFAVSIFTAWDGWINLWATICSLFADFPKTVGVGLPFGLSAELSEVQSSLAVWLVVKAFSSITFATWLEKVVQERVLSEIDFAHKERKDAINKAQAAQLLELLVQKAGISFTSAQGLSGRNAVDQAYAEVIRTAVIGSSTVKIMSIAACQTIGLREKSMLYELLRTNRIAPLKVILMDPEKGRGAIDERARLLGGSVHPDKIREEIGRTVDALKDLNSSREEHEGVISLRYCPFHPGFRLLITDDTAFVSAYQPGKQGHETPVIAVKKIDKDHGPVESFFDAFVQIFENTWNASSAVSVKKLSQNQSNPVDKPN